ncbi:hypothetical protein KYK29_21130 [Shinella daejeonensis]|uniref:hypothetical protein n=1 Tax=Shinella daejeonensis TaxID=659017 RepID=UPI0020C78280|nr:hypothetical protein [Shinella daejeonensis]MCP8897436.1 hypothetical protein [Shinella daejeonensis]
MRSLSLKAFWQRRPSSFIRSRGGLAGFSGVTTMAWSEDMRHDPLETYAFRTEFGIAAENRPLDATSNHRRESLSDLENSLLQFRKAKRAADESMRRAQDVPEPHSTDNTIFIALWEAHLADREALFDAMRRLDRARED